MFAVADYHMHTPLCRHAVGNPIELARHACSVGLNEIGFSDHSPMLRDDFDEWRMFYRQLPEYISLVQAARREHPELQIKIGLEVDYIPGHEDWIRRLAAEHDWDYFIGSVHYISDTWDIDNPAKISKWRERDVDEVWRIYFERLTAAAASGLFDIIGHADLPKKFNFIPRADIGQIYDRFLKTCADKNVAVEINTAGLRKDCRELYPAQRWVTAAAAAKVPLTFGSDAHAPAEVGLNFQEALTSARAAGYTHWRQLTKRKPTDIVL